MSSKMDGTRLFKKVGIFIFALICATSPSCLIMNSKNRYSIHFAKDGAFKERVTIPFQDDTNRSQVENEFTGKSWSEVDMLQVNKRIGVPVSEITSIMTDKAFSFFLPTFMSFTDDHPGKADTLPEALLMRIFRDSERGRNLFSILSNGQKETVRSFLYRNFGQSKSYRSELNVVSEYLVPTPRSK